MKTLTSTLLLKRTDSTNKDFIYLVNLLNQDLAKRDGEDHAFYNQYNGLENLKNIMVVYHKDTVVGCGAFKKVDLKTIEIKRMYTLPEVRGKGIATVILENLEKWANELGYSRCILETGKRQPEAISLYKKKGYRITPNYEPYIGIENSICFEKII